VGATEKMTFEITILDDLLPKEMADKIETTMLNDHFPWYFKRDVTFKNPPKDYQNTIAFGHSFFKQGVIKSAYLDLVKDIPAAASAKLKLKEYLTLVHARSFMQLPLRTKKGNEHCGIHTDMDEPHLVILYYPIDADGDTFFFANDKKTIIKRITPKKNRAVFFNGLIYHASSSPTAKERIIINFDLVVS
jgi:hypothetical protein